MVIMALDHVRDYFHINAIAGNDPTNLDTTTPELFFTRFITHFCAPTFVFLAGTSAFLYGQKKTKKELFKFLMYRGLWLIFVEIVIMNLLWWFDPTYGFINLQVIWAIGISMVLLSLLVFLPWKLILCIGLLMVLGHNFLDEITTRGQDFFTVLWYITHQGGFIRTPNHLILFMYPLVPWVGVMALGYVFGRLYAQNYNSLNRKKMLLLLGFGSLTLFIILRIPNLYGDPSLWAEQDSTIFSILSVLNVTKYPPSLLFLLVTLGPAFLFLYFTENIKNKIVSFFLIFGRVPFFYYLLHIFIIHLAALLVLMVSGKDWTIMILDENIFTSNDLQGYGYPLSVVYLVWIIIVFLLYFPCKKYMEYKLRNKNKWWLSYL
ncbi:DUF1624 domain-containing protein [Christiangramia sabulilitoris]|uniref:DUF1624 domain-containing protein n=2 Tax=Christiangramia sabulilitoris TaxID=2583991 RepID=A0A550I0N2_9FLAO|nr:DUF1624 domain-containing protein [Christiangramia sabulilitoris]